MMISGAKAEEVLSWIEHGSLREYQPVYWTLDPIDGTKGFLRREQYALCVAKIVGGEPVVGALSCPNLPIDFSDPSKGKGVVISGAKGGGAWCSCLRRDVLTGSQEKPQKIVLKPKDATNLRFCESVESGHGDHSVSARVAEELKIKVPPLRLDSQAKYAALIRGDAEIYLRPPARKKDGKWYVECIWDHAAGVVSCITTSSKCIVALIYRSVDPCVGSAGALLLQEAGGVVTDISGRKLDFSQVTCLDLFDSRPALSLTVPTGFCPAL